MAFSGCLGQFQDEAHCQKDVPTTTTTPKNSSTRNMQAPFPSLVWQVPLHRKNKHDMFATNEKFTIRS